MLDRKKVGGLNKNLGQQGISKSRLGSAKKVSTKETGKTEPRKKGLVSSSMLKLLGTNDHAPN